MKICAACHTDLPKDSYSKKQWKLDESQRRCKVCTANNREVQPIPKQDNDNPNTTEIIKILDSVCLEDVEKISDEELIKQPPSQYGDCPICFLLLPAVTGTGSRYYSCCGKIVCSGCSSAPVYDDQGNKVDNKKCPFCRTPCSTSAEETIGRLKKRVKLGDPIAMYNLGWYYNDGRNGFPQDYTKALEFWHRAGELGDAKAYNSIGVAYHKCHGVKFDMKKEEYYYKLAAIRGDPIS